MQPWRTTDATEATKANAALQFGHGHAAVETPAPENPTDTSARLQFGHGHAAVENMALPLIVTVKVLRFNSATAMQPWRTFNVWSTLKHILALQFGHGHAAVEN